MALLEPGTDEQLHNRLVVASMLNHLELVAVAIKEGAFSEAIYENWNRSNYVDAWNKAESYVTERRKKADRPTAYINFEKLAQKWARK